MNEVTREKNVTGDIDGVDYKYTTLTSDVTYEDYYNIAKACLEELKDDSIIKNLLMKYSVTEEDYNTQIQAAIDSLEAEKQAAFRITSYNVCYTKLLRNRKNSFKNTDFACSGESNGKAKTSDSHHLSWTSLSFRCC